MCYRAPFLGIENSESYQKKLAKAQAKQIEDLLSGQDQIDLEIIKEKQALCSRQRAIIDLGEIGETDAEGALRAIFNVQWKTRL